MTKQYYIKEIFYSLVGEGFHSGRAALFVRFTGCNLWSGKEEQRQTAACNFCDTDFNGTDGSDGGVYSANELLEKINDLHPNRKDQEPYIWLTGGEPALQADQALIDLLKQSGYKLAIETNGTQVLPNEIDWICVSPKGTSPLKTISGDELKLVYPQTEINPNDYQEYDFKYFYIQPKDEAIQDHTAEAKDFCIENPFWKLSLQMHKHLQIR